MNKRKIFIVIFLLVLLAVVFGWYKSQDIRRVYQEETTKRLKSAGNHESHILTEKDIEHLPAPVQKYITYVGAIGKQKVQSYRVVCQGEMKRGPKQDWMQIKAEQYNFIDKPERLFYISGKVAGIPLIGLDSYIKGKGNMLIKLAGLIKVADAKGVEMDKSEMVTLLNDTCILAPSALIDSRIQWETLDSLTVKALYTDNGLTISAILYFNEKGELINFITEDRYMTADDNTYKRYRWSTPLRDYKEINGHMVPSHCEAIWQLPEGDYCYAKFKVKELAYNPSK